MPIEAQVTHVPRHYQLVASLTPSAALELIQALDGFDLETDLGQLREQLREAWYGELPTPIARPIGDDEDGGTAVPAA